MALGLPLPAGAPTFYGSLMGGAHRDNRLLAILCILGAVGFSSTQDAITKSLSGQFAAYETVIFRCLGSLPVLIVLLARTVGFRSLATPLLARVLLRSLILCGGYFSFVLAIAAMPIANGVAIYFTMPFFVAGLAGPMLGEHVRLHRWLAIVAAFLGVLVIVRPGAGVFEPAALFALLSAFLYAVGQMYGRPLAQQISPTIIAMWQNTVYFSVALLLAILFNSFDFGFLTHKSLVFLSRPWVSPGFADLLVMLTNGLLAAVGMVLFIFAYKYGETNFVAPLEYSAMIWAMSYGFLVFGDRPDRYMLAGAAVVVAAGILMVWRDRQLDRAIAA
ncbi:MAG: DMT family transporter [Rhizobiales bacterium]|nr:DMT family transporter [Hyphomicrobiales bacterium]MBI3673744.1 DMT family transporter [Hyphomicrobiales bacterium]